MRLEEWDFRVSDTDTSFSQPVLEHFIRMGMPPPVVEGTAKTLVVSKARAARLKAEFGISRKPGETVKQRTFQGILGTIERLFKTSAEFCLELEARAGELPSKRVRKKESIAGGVPDLDELKRRRSRAKTTAAEVFEVVPRTISNWIGKEKLNTTLNGRIAVDQKFEDLFNDHHLPTHEK